MPRRVQIYGLAALLITLVLTLWFTMRSEGPGIPGVQADVKFTPLQVQEPQLRLDELEELKTLEYSGAHRNIFVEAPVAAPMTPARKAQQAAHPFVGPMLPPPPPPLAVPAQFFGYESSPGSTKRIGFFTQGDEILVVTEGNTFLNGFRLIRIGNESAEVEEVATGRRATVPLVQPSAALP
jgi:hypothetical protein